MFYLSFIFNGSGGGGGAVDSDQMASRSTGALGRDQKVCLSVRPSVRHTPKPLDEFQPNFVYKLLT